MGSRGGLYGCCADKRVWVQRYGVFPKPPNILGKKLKITGNFFGFRKQIAVM
jgi:hypothetical protein